MCELILSAKLKRHINLNNLIMVGRQNLHLSPDHLALSLKKFGYSINNISKLISKNNTFADAFFKEIGAKNVHSIDASNYEDATIIHDLNEPLSNEYKNKYSLVLDSGTLEHVFNFPQAIKNCMELTQVGGHFMGIYPCNNFFGHGFYQFSSELFYRVFCETNGFEIMDVVLFVDDKETTFYNVPDTSEAHQRIQFTNTKPVYIYVLAKRVSQTSLFENQPLQMDYAELKWKGKRSSLKPVVKKKTLKGYIPQYFKNILKALINKADKPDDIHFKKSFFSIYNLKSN
ncbi:MAG: hypothetical protein P8K68_00900 [Algibacter sp.]|uniref:hypothetical protein n=1 Tax=Algibacter sp. TaxID=1872428 RepID=UPI002620D2E7|nr:hypothetical protein [Algibacter sp.]MDG1729359.1 hypothetical protein [Algibacter sp.]MDG2177330.1 hypothetical protein [Algibacter sp.]